MQACQTLPAHTAANLLDGFLFPDEDAKGFAVKRITGLQFADGEIGCEGWLDHENNGSDKFQSRPTDGSNETPIWVYRDRNWQSQVLYGPLCGRWIPF